eukprot:jgi/Botrbrau1/14243/Bobra.0381s0005.1
MRDEQTRAGRNNSSGPPVEIKQKSVGGPVRMEGGGFMSHIVKGEHRDTKIPFTDEEIMAQELNNLTEEQLSTLDTDAPPYLLAVQKESYRLFSVLAVLLRVAPCDFSVCGYHIPKGTALHLNTYYANRNNEVWERADEFLPERWIPGHALATKCQENLVSFGAGSLQCSGMRFAQQEANLVLGTIFRKMDFTLSPGQDVLPIMSLFVTRPLNGIFAVPKPLGFLTA